jgi:hypothetical protein
MLCSQWRSLLCWPLAAVVEAAAGAVMVEMAMPHPDHHHSLS